MSDPLLIESIRLKDGVFYNLEYHSARMNRACEMLSIEHKPYDLVSFLPNFTIPQTGLYKCRVLYDTRVKKIHYVPYHLRTINSLQVVHASTVDYACKTINRPVLDEIYTLRGDCDDIIIVKQGMVTDSYYGNLLFLQDGKWYTPDTYLLAGTQRQALLDEGLIFERAIRVQDLHLYEEVKIISAMIGIDDGDSIQMENVNLS